MDAESATEVEEVAGVFTREEAALSRALPAPDLGLWHRLICIIHQQIIITCASALLHIFIRVHEN